MRTFEKSVKLNNVCYDIRGPVMDEANRMIRAGEEVLKLNIGNPAPFGFRAPDELIRNMSDNLVSYFNKDGQFENPKGDFLRRERQ